MTAPEPTQPLTDKLAAARAFANGEIPASPEAVQTGREIAASLLAEVDRLRAENTALRASLDQFRSFPTEPGPGKWSTSYRMGYADSGRDVRAIARALDQSGEGQANG